jgi:hypothetical protein
MAGRNQRKILLENPEGKGRHGHFCPTGKDPSELGDSVSGTPVMEYDSGGCLA